MSKSEPTAAQARYRMRFSTHAVPNSAKKSVSKFNRMWLGKAMAFVAVFSMVFSSFGIPAPVANAAAPNWNATGSYVFKFTYLGSDYNHNVNLTQTGAALTGNGTSGAYAWALTSGSVDANTISFTANYSATADAVTPLTTMNVTGTITGGGTMSGTWTDNYQGGSRAGTWETTQGRAAPIVAPESTVKIYGNTGVENEKGKWIFNRDLANATPIEFNFEESSIGDGSLEVLPLSATPAKKFIGEYFAKELVSDVNSISFDFQMGAATNANQFYMNVYVNDGSNPDEFYDCKYDVVATTGNTSSFETVIFDPTQSYPVTQRGTSSIVPCPSSPSGLPSGALIRAISLNLGDTTASDTGMSGYFDKVVVDLDSGKTTYDFEPKTPTNVTIEKVWQDASGAEIPAPSNKDDITINVETEENDDITCQYDDDDLVCDDEIESTTEDTIEVTETGLPAGWVVDPTTVGDVTPVCEDSNVVNKVVVDDNALDCTHTVINKRVDAPVCSTELVVNGSFETPEVTNFLKFQYFNSGDANLGWSVDAANGVGDAPVELHEGFSTWNAHGGNQYVELDSTKSSKIYQDLPTRNGGVYTVSLWTSPRPLTSSAENKVEVQMGGQILETITSSGLSPLQLKPVWTKHTYSFTATGPITRLEITDRGNSNAFGSFVDDVSVIEDCISDVTICKVDQNQNPLADWDVMLKGDKLETVTVPANDEDGVSTVALLEAGQDYLFVANGTADAGDGIEFDADYSFRTPTSATWTDSVSTYEGLGDQLLDLQVNGSTVAWDDNATYNTNHKYNYFFAGAGSTATFRINDTFASNNSGYLTVDIYPVIKGTTTGELGCVTLLDVDYGSYKLDELMKDGWINLSGQNTTALVDAPTETFTLMNKCTKACESAVKICKKDTNGNGLSGWNVFLKGPKLDSLELDSADVNGSTTSDELVAGQQYVVEVSGEWTNRAGESVDASYTTMDNWTTPLAAPQGGYSDDLLEVVIDNAFVNWGAYQGEPDHKYSLVVTGTGSTTNFRVYDAASGNPADMDASWYGDNNGELEVNIYPIYQGVTGSDGCVTIAEVPFGTYTLGETMQEGWENVRGEGSTVIVNEPSEPGINEEENPFILVNECTGNNCQTATICEESAISITSGAMTKFDGLKEGTAPLFLNSAASYPSGTTGTAVGVMPTGYAGAWDGAINDADFIGSGAVYVSNDVTQPTFTGGAGFDGSVDSWRLFRHNFTIPTGATAITSPVLHFAADNEVTVFLDNVQIGFSASFNSVTDTVPLTLTPGAHTLEFAVKNYAFDQTNNPTGVIYKLDTVTYSCPDDGPDDNKDNDVKGVVYEDSNENGNQEDGEPYLPGQTVKLIKVTDENPENTGTVLSETEIATDVSDENGYYEFIDVAEGCYIVRELPDGYVITEPATVNEEYYISIGGADCDFDNSESLIIGFLFKTADAAADTANFVAYSSAVSLNFGNFDNGQGGNGGSSSGSGSNNNPGPQGQVLGDSTTTPSDTPQGQVLGATTLPRTGSPTWVLLMIALLAAPMFYFRRLAVKKA